MQKQLTKEKEESAEIKTTNQGGIMIKKTCLYVRVSTMDQVGGAESQTRALVDWCAKQAVTNYEIYTDHGISGAKESRPALNRLMQSVENGEVEQVVVFAFSRFARSTSHLLKALERFKTKSVRFQSITESLDTNSPMGLALLTILGCLAQLERELLRERVLAGMRNAKAKGVKIGRERKRNDVLIHSLLEAQLSFREIAKIAKCSHGSVSASKKEWLEKKRANEKLSNEASTVPIEDLPRPEIIVARIEDMIYQTYD
ncbi:MAG: recombinase family protein [Bdellovibrio sp.]